MKPFTTNDPQRIYSHLTKLSEHMLILPLITTLATTPLIGQNELKSTAFSSTRNFLLDYCIFKQNYSITNLLGFHNKFFM